MEGVDALAGGCREAEMQARSRIRRDRPLRPTDPELHAVAPVTKAVGALAQARISERLERRIVEALGAAGVAHPNGNMIKHDGPPSHSRAADAEVRLQLPGFAVVGRALPQPTE